MLLRAKLFRYYEKFLVLPSVCMGCHFPRKKLFRGTLNRQKFYSFRRNSNCFAEPKKLGIPFRAISAEDKKLEIPIRTTFLEEKNTWNFVILFQTISQKRKTVGIFFRVIKGAQA